GEVRRGRVGRPGGRRGHRGGEPDDARAPRAGARRRPQIGAGDGPFRRAAPGTCRRRRRGCGRHVRTGRGPLTTDPPFDHPHVAALIALAMAEDLGAGDRTSQATVAEDARARGRLLAKEELVICGLPLLPRVFGRLGPVSCELLAAEGRLVRSGEVVATVEGGARTLLAGERLVLNLVQHLCGIATLTRRYVERVAGTTLVVRDTRKTVPGMR